MKNIGSFDPVRHEGPVGSVRPTNAQGRAVTTVVSAARTARTARTIDPERTAELRKKVLEGAYNTLDVIEQVAKRILQRGDL